MGRVSRTSGRSLANVCVCVFSMYLDGRNIYADSFVYEKQLGFNLCVFIEKNRVLLVIDLLLITKLLKALCVIYQSHACLMCSTFRTTRRVESIVTSKPSGRARRADTNHLHDPTKTTNPLHLDQNPPTPIHTDQYTRIIYVPQAAERIDDNKIASTYIIDT